MKACPFCGEKIQEEAVKCRYCKEWLQQRSEPQTATASQRQKVEAQKPAISTIVHAKSSTAQQAPAGVGGWLLLCVIVMMLGPLMGAGNINYDIMSAEQQNPAIKALAQWSTYKAAIWSVFALFAFLNVYGGIGLARGKEWSAVRQAKIIWWISGPVLIIVIGLIIPIALFGEDFVDPLQVSSGLIASLIAAGIWTAYLSKSKRVRNTYGGTTIDRETWFSKHSRALAALIISIPIIGIVAAIGIPGYLGMQERSRRAQTAPASSSLPQSQTERNQNTPIPDEQQAQPLAPVPKPKLDSVDYSDLVKIPSPPASTSKAPHGKFKIPLDVEDPYESSTSAPVPSPTPSSDFISRLTELVPDWIQINGHVVRKIPANPQWTFFLAQKDLSSGRTYQQILDIHVKNNDAAGAANIFRAFKQSIANAPARKSAAKRQDADLTYKPREKSLPTMQKWVDEKGNVHYSGMTGEGQ